MIKKMVLSNFCKLIFGFSLSFSSFNGDAQVQFTKEYGGIINDQVLNTPSFKETDGSFVIAGLVAGSGTNKGVQITKTNDHGVVIWSKKYSRAENYNSVCRILKNASNQYVIIGTSGPNGGVFLFKLDINGNYIAGSEKTLFPFSNSNGNGGFQVSDAKIMTRWNKFTGIYNEYILVGNAAQDYVTKGFVATLSSDFTVTKSAYISKVGFKTNADCVIDIPGGTPYTSLGYIVAAHPEGYQSSLIRLKNDLTEDPSYTESGYRLNTIASGLYIQDLEKTLDGNFVVGGYFWYKSSSTFTSNNAAILMKVNPSLGFIWSKAYSVSNNWPSNFKEQECYDICATTDGGYALTGEMGTGVSGQNAMFLIKTNSVGTSVYGKKYQATGSPTFGSTILQANDGGFGLVGINLANNSSLLFVKTNNIGETCQNVQNITNSDQSYTLNKQIIDYYDVIPYVVASTLTNNVLVNYIPTSSGCDITENCATFNSTISGSSNFCSSSSLVLTGGVTIITPGLNNISNHKWDIYESDISGNIISGGYSNLGGLINGAPSTTTISGSTLPCGKYFVVRLTTYTISCGFDSSDKIIYVDCQPVINAGADFTICSGDLPQLNFTSSTWPINIFQSGIEFAIASAMASPYYITSVPTTTTTYTLTSGPNGTCTTGASDNVVMTVIDINPDFNWSFSGSGTSGTFTGTSLVTNPYNTWTLYQYPEFSGSPVPVGFVQTTTNASFTGLPLTYSSGAIIQYELCHTAGAAPLYTKYSCPKSICHSSGGRSHTNSAAQHKATIQNQLGFDNSISISPNPTTGKFNVELNEVAAEKVTVYNMLGKVVYEIDVTENSRSLDIDLTEFPSSIYMIHVNVGGKVIMKKVVKD